MRQRAKAAALLGFFGLLWLGTTSCTSNDLETLGVEVSFDALPRAMQPIRVQVYVVESCDALTVGEPPEDPIASTYALRDGGEGPRLGTLEPGRYGLYAIAQDASCVAVAAGCVAVTIDSNTKGPLAVTLGGFSGEGCAVGEQCVVESGECVPRTEDCSSQPDETPCVAGAEDGSCRMGECCTGCWDGGTCHVGDEQDRCGSGGAFCKLCECFSDVCVEGACKPTPAFSSVGVGLEHACAIADDGHLWCWGSNAQGELGLGNVALPNCDATGCTQPSELTTLVEGSVPTWSQASAGDGVTCAIRATDSSLWCWGSNDSGRMGAPSEVTGSDEPFLVSPAVHQEVDNEGLTGCAIRAADGSLWCWGANNRGQAGQGTTGSDVYGPSKVPYGSAWDEVSVGNEFVFAITDAQLWAWGNNINGQMGTGATGNTVHPAATGFTGSGVEAGGKTTCALDSAGAGYCWGDNTNGQVGNGDSSGMDAHEPALISGGHSFDHFGLGDDFACAVTTSGALYCWGRNRSGQLGVGQSFNALSQAAEPMRLGTDFDWLRVSAGGQSACALRQDGSLWCWGNNDRGQLGLGDTDSRTVPTRLCF